MSDQQKPPSAICPECGAGRQTDQQECWLCLGRQKPVSTESVGEFYIDVSLTEKKRRKPKLPAEKPLVEYSTDDFPQKRRISHALVWSLSAAMCLLIGIGIALFSLPCSVAFIFATVPALCLISIVAMFDARESKNTPLIAGLIKGIVAFLTVTLGVVVIFILAIIVVVVAIVAAFLEVCSSTFPNGH
ncbi:MAG: hypothetical protein ACI9G1_001551 [Pirellulaceae bacterium]|jgi:hypothetical protein